MSQKSIFIGIPIYGSVDPHFFKCAMALCAEFSQNISILPWQGDSLVPRARNALSARFLQTDCTHLLFLDSDLIFSNEHINRIASRDEDIVGGFYPKKQEGEAALVWNATVPPSQPREDGLVPARYMGTGFLMISRAVFEGMIKAYGKDIGYMPDKGGSDSEEWDFWSVGVYKYADGTKRYLSEDWYFCQRALDLGFKVWGDTTIALKHSGTAVFPLSYQEKTYLTVNQKMPEHLKFTGDMIVHANKIFDGEYDCLSPKTPRTVLDIGANQGAFSAWAQMRWPEAKVLAYEPIKENMEKLAENAPSAFRFPVAVTSDGRTVVLKEGMDNSGEWSEYHTTTSGETRTVASRRAGSIRHCDFVKVDAEGNELDILTHLDLSHTDSVACEWHRRDDRRALINLLCDQGFFLIKDVVRNNERGVLCFCRTRKPDLFLGPKDKAMNSAEVQKLCQPLSA